MNVINLDHNATTTVAPEVIEAVARVHRDGLANPASGHRLGQRARQTLEAAREAIAELLGADLTDRKPDRLVFCATGSEANNLAILGMVRAATSLRNTAQKTAKGHLIFSGMEHSCIVGAIERLIDEGNDVDALGVHPDGTVRVERFKELLRDQTRLCTCLLANHETGVIQPIGELARLSADAGIPLHTDAVQAVGKLPIRFRELGVSSMSVAAHKFHGPPSIAALLLRHDVTIEPVLFGGNQQYGLRPGTEPVALAVGMRTALELFQRRQEEEIDRMLALRDRFESSLKKELPELIIHGLQAERLPQTVNIAFPNINNGEAFFTALDLAGIACSMGSACQTGACQLSVTLLSMGVPHRLSNRSFRFSFCNTTTEQEIDEAVRIIIRTYRSQQN
ncbi:MAG: cysteine desulfurase family protein [Planctomycetia bacterium]|jgi:cysteine desulfurase